MASGTMFNAFNNNQVRSTRFTYILLSGGIQDGGRISRLIATTALAHPLSARSSHSPASKAKKAADAADAVRLQHGPLQALYVFWAASPRIVAARASTGGRHKKN
ncbi:hypothetical protein NDU88_003448 [Pleurodeles waltl]|uniref:Uncharacterized protein n=1 Tax=Pleurodeles waltl TaxID=8319 RepID=A0AAV7KXH0_PLEWA|nr:hypothetical protein NDU88_003448 [Pleurodeles waltl]